MRFVNLVNKTRLVNYYFVTPEKTNKHIMRTVGRPRSEWGYRGLWQKINAGSSGKRVESATSQYIRRSAHSLYCRFVCNVNRVFPLFTWRSLWQKIKWWFFRVEKSCLRVSFWRPIRLQTQWSQTALPGSYFMSRRYLKQACRAVFSLNAL